MKTAKYRVQNTAAIFFSLIWILGSGKLLGDDVENAEKNADPSAQVEIYTKEIALRPHDPTGYAFRGMAYEKLGDSAKALADYSTALSLKPDNFNAFVLYFRRAVLEEEKGLFASAKADYAAAVKLDMYPRNFDLFIRQGYLLGRMDDLPGAIVSLSAAIELAPSDYRPYLARATAKADLGEFDGALADATEAIKLSPNTPRCYSAHSYVLTKKGDYAAAIQALTKEIDLSDDKAPALCQRAGTYAQTGDFENAFKDLARISDSQPAFAPAHLVTGDIYFIQGKLSEALAAYRKAESLQKKGSRSASARIKRDLLALRLEGIPPEGEVVDQPERPMANWTKSIERYLRGKLSEKEFLIEAAKGPPHLVQSHLVGAYFYIGELALVRKDFQKALHSFGECIAKDDPNHLVYQFAQAEIRGMSTMTVKE